MIRFTQGDITKVNDVDAIVNAANKTLLGGGGVDGAIHRAAGIDLKLECMKLHGCKVGEAKITGAHKLPLRNIIHTVGPVWQDGTHGEDSQLASCYEASLRLAQTNGIHSIAFPSISTGVYHFPVDRAANIAICTVLNYLCRNQGSFDLVEWVLFDRDTYQTYVAAYKAIVK